MSIILIIMAGSVLVWVGVNKLLKHMNIPEGWEDKNGFHEGVKKR